MSAEAFSERGFGQAPTSESRYDVLSPRRMREELEASLRSRPIVASFEERTFSPTPRSLTGARLR